MTSAASSPGSTLARREPPHDPSVAAFLREHPWPDDLARHGTPIDFLWHFEVDAPPADLWPYVMDTSRFNRALGMGRMDFREVDGVLHGSTRNAGVVQEWIEDPWVWVSEKTLTCVRRYSRGFAHCVRSIYVLDPIDDGKRTRMAVYFGWIPRAFWWGWFLRATFPTIGRGYGPVLDAIARELHDEQRAPKVYERPSVELAPDASARLDALCAELAPQLETRNLPRAGLDRLASYLRAGDEIDLNRMKVWALAKRWEIDPSELLTVFLHATRAGLLSMSWDVICPHCRGVRHEARTLGDVPPRGACEVCRIDFETDSENSIEITFHPQPAIRDVPKVFFCAAEPATKRHIKFKQRLAPGETRTIETTLSAGRHRARIDGAKRYQWIDVVDDAATAELRWKASEVGAETRLALRPTFVLENDSDEPKTFVVENAEWADDALRPAQLFTLQEFRDLFTEEYITTDVQLSVGEQTILFTDMIGSTKFYDSRGDPQAFAEVKRHFTEVYAVVKKHRGAVVKTIGDAVMAAFHDPVDALRAAVGIHERFPEGRADTSIRLRISMNRGPCIAVNLNSAIDFFGRTVNVASKLQSIVEAGQISFPTTMHAAPGVAAYVERLGVPLEAVTVTGKTLAAPIPSYRLDVNGLTAARISAASPSKFPPPPSDESPNGTPIAPPS